MKYASVFRSQKGAALIELAIVVPMLVLLLVGLIEMGRYLAFTVRLSNAAHAGVQYGAQNINQAGSTDVANAACNDSGFSCTSSTPKPGHTAPPDTVLITSALTCTSKTSPCPAGSLILQVNASGTFQPLLNVPVFNSMASISAQAKQQVNP